MICMFPVTNSMLPMALNIAVGPLLRLCVFVCVVPLVVRSILDGTWYQSRGVSPSKLGEGGVNSCKDRGWCGVVCVCVCLSSEPGTTLTREGGFSLRVSWDFLFDGSSSRCWAVDSLPFCRCWGTVASGA